MFIRTVFTSASEWSCICMILFDISSVFFGSSNTAFNGELVVLGYL